MGRGMARISQHGLLCYSMFEMNEKSTGASQCHAQHGVIYFTQSEKISMTNSGVVPHAPIVQPFKRAKHSLRIRSVRAGFGTNGGWRWELPCDRDGASTASAITREPVRAERRVPVDWVEGVGRLNYFRPPTDVPPHRWRQFVSDCHSFLNSSENWAERAAELGWDARALFGCHRNYPLMHLWSAGLLWAINSGKLVQLHRDWAVIELPVNRQRTFNRRDVAAGKVTLPWDRA